MASIGIDLGTTNSAAAYMSGEQTHIVNSGRADGLIPSVVAYLKPHPGAGNEKMILVGQAALDYAPTDPTNAIFSIKRLMGRHYSEPKVIETAKHVSYAIAQAADGSDSGVRVRLGPLEFTPVQISSMILKQIKESAQAALGQPVTHAVITVPAYFEERQRAATRKAGEEAGLVIKKIIDEPSAAAVAYGFTISRGEPRRLLVFDLGGGTFDVSIIVTAKDPEGRNHFEPLEITGDSWLGGDDFDREVVGEIISWVKQQYAYDPSDNKVFLLHAKQAAEKAKIALSTATETNVILPALLTLPDGRPLSVVMSLTRVRFNALIGHYVDRALGIVRQALSNAHLRAEDITNVLLVGGSTLVPLVRDSVAGLFGSEKVQQIMSPHHAVALGAGILAATLKGVQCPNESCRQVNDESNERCAHCGTTLASAASVGGTSINDITAFNFGIRAVRGDAADAFEVLIPKGTPYPLPAPKTETFYTTAPNFIRVPVFEGDEMAGSKNSEQGCIELNEEFFRAKGADVTVNTPIEVSMNFSRDRILQVKVRVHGTNIEEEKNILRNSAPPPEPTEDENWKRWLEILIRMCEGFLGKYGGMTRDTDRKRLTWQMEKAQEALKSDNIKAIKDAVMALDVALDSCDTASLLFRAEQLKGGIGGARAEKLQGVIDEIRARWYEGDHATVVKLEQQLKRAVDMIRSREEAIPDQSTYKGLLRKYDAGARKG